MLKNVEKSKITRRGFLKGTGGAVAFLALSGNLFPISKQIFAQTDGTAVSETVEKPGLCHSCHLAKCSLLYTVKDGVLVHVEGNPEGPWNKGKCCVRGQSSPAFVYNPYRVKSPMKRTNPKKGLDVDPGWVEISWDEAINTMVEKLSAIRKSDPRKLWWMQGFPAFPNQITGMRAIFPTVFGTPNQGMITGAMCSVHLTNGLVQGGFAQYPDWDYAKYILSVGNTTAPNIGPGDGAANYIVDKVKSGTRLVVVDPRCSPEAKLGEWVPIRPASDFPFMLSLAHVILHELNTFDVWFVKNRTTGPYLISPEGDYLKNAANKPLVWDSVAKAAKAFDDPSIGDYALEGSYEVNGVKVQPAFELLKQGMVKYTPEWAEELTTIPAAKIREIAKDLIENAQIGSTVNINGVTLPLRPAVICVSRGLTSHRDGHHAFWMSMVVNQLIGAVAVPGGNIVAPDPKALTPGEDGVVIPENFHCKFTPWQWPPQALEAREFQPYCFDITYRMIDLILDPKPYYANYTPEMFISFAANLYTKGGNPERIGEALAKIPFVVSIAHHVDEHTAFADLVMPEASYLEMPTAFYFQMYRPGSARLGNIHIGHREIIKPVNNVRIMDEVFTDIAERMGMLYGPGPDKLNFMTNIILGIPPQFWLDLGKKHKAADVVERYLKGQYGPQITLDALAAKGFVYDEMKPQDVYNYTAFPGKTTRHPLYNVYYKRAGEQLLAGMEKAGVKHPGFSDEEIKFYYTGVPAWKPTPTQSAPAEYDLYGVVWKIPQFLFDISGVGTNPWLVETAEQNPDFGKILLNTATADKKGLKDGDMVYVESQFGGKIGPYPVKTTELLHPDCMGVASGIGRLVSTMNPLSKKNIPYNRLLASTWESIEVITGGIENSPRMKITKA